MKPTEVTIDGVVFLIRPFDPFTQLQLFGDLQREILPAVGGIANIALARDPEAAKGPEADAAAIAAFRDLSAKFDGAALKKWAERLLQPDFVSYAIDGREPAKLDRLGQSMAFKDFSGVLELLYHVGKVNFANPLARWAGLTGLAQKLTARLSENSATTSSTS